MKIQIIIGPSISRLFNQSVSYLLYKNFVLRLILKWDLTDYCNSTGAWITGNVPID